MAPQELVKAVPEPVEPVIEEPRSESESEAARSRLGTPPPSVTERKRRAGAGASAAAATTGRSRRRPTVSRIAALIALGAVLIALVVLVVSLSSKSEPKAPPPTPVVNVLIPEGKTRLQIAEIAKANGLTGSYRKASEHSPLLEPEHYGAPKGTPDLEGFLFPATYELDKGAARRCSWSKSSWRPSPNISARRRSQRPRTLQVTPYELLTVASMVEREAQVPCDRAKIAAVIYNRLAQGIPLGIDASIYYAVELEKSIPTYTKELTE